MSHKALSLWEPWATLIAEELKRIETRHWSTKYRGRLAIHAAKRKPGFGKVGEWWYGRSAYDHSQWVLNQTDSVASADVPMPLGAIVATCTLADVVPMTESGHYRPDDENYMEPHLLLNGLNDHLWLWDGQNSHNVEDQRPYGDYAPGRYAWLLEDVKPTTARCPACWGSGKHPADPQYESRFDPDCPLCDGDGKCDPVPATGHQGLWNWDPLAA